MIFAFSNPANTKVP